MQFFLTLPHDSAEEPTMASMDPAELETALAAVEQFNTDLQESGAFRFAGGLHPPSSAKTVDATSGEPAVVDGPFVEAPEYVGGFWVIEAAAWMRRSGGRRRRLRHWVVASRCAPFRTRESAGRQLGTPALAPRGADRARSLHTRFVCRERQDTPAIAVHATERRRRVLSLWKSIALGRRGPREPSEAACPQPHRDAPVT